MRGYSRGFVYIVKQRFEWGYVFVGFLDFGEGVGDVIFVIDVFRTDFKGTSTALKVRI